MRMLTFDPREPDQYRTPYYLTFRGQLAASEHINVLAQMLRSVSLLFDGNHQEPDPVVEPRYLKAAEMAVRYTSEEARISAERAMEDYAFAKYDELEARLKSCDCDRATRRSLIMEHARNSTTVYLQHLKNGPVRSALEWDVFEANEARDASL